MATIRLRTNGPIVFENMETTTPGIFACGNVVHVHDLVDYVSAESEYAGASAAEYVRAAGRMAVSGRTQLEIRTGPGLTYTVPQLVRLPLPADRLGIYFRTNRVYGKCRIDVSALSGENRRLIQSFPKEYMTPGEMQRISLPGDRLKDQDCSALLLECQEG